MTDTFEKNSYEEEPVILESTVNAALKVLGRNKSPGIDGIPIELFQATETESVKILIRIRQHENQTMVYGLETFNIHPSLPGGRCRRAV